jgi:hypothetical protein
MILKTVNKFMFSTLSWANLIVCTTKSAKMDPSYWTIFTQGHNWISEDVVLFQNRIIKGFLGY